ncbi:hypothetical protein RvY_11992 [Ramazzottius varieornatus]|uniref:Uncharacterized protein n=1 Tax=Ramazzottius varieornatus TaxID=947166 RepID=A0A1D1VI10_RAMVA|nr:hypothetical protein RvY_11992 [Ramazzottius varieornatus]
MQGGGITLDFWEEEYTETSYLGWELEEKLLLCAEWDTMDRKIAEIVRAFLFRKLATIKLLQSELRSVIYVTDAGSNVKAAFTLRNKPAPSRITCAGHQLNTGIRKCFNSNPKSEFVIPAAAIPALDLRNEVKSLVEHCKRAAIVKQLKTSLKQECD